MVLSACRNIRNMFFVWSEALSRRVCPVSAATAGAASLVILFPAGSKKKKKSGSKCVNSGFTAPFELGVRQHSAGTIRRSHVTPRFRPSIVLSPKISRPFSLGLTLTLTLTLSLAHLIGCQPGVLRPS